MLTSVPPSTGTKRQATHIPFVTPPVCTNSMRPLSGSGRWTASQRDRDRTATGAHREPTLAVRVGQASDVSVVGEDLWPALNLGGERKDALPRGSHQELDRALHGASTSSSAAGESASVAGRQSPSAEPSRSAARVGTPVGGPRTRAAVAPPGTPGPASSARPWPRMLGGALPGRRLRRHRRPGSRRRRLALSGGHGGCPRR